jgi:hypothetical protein
MKRSVRWFTSSSDEPDRHGGSNPSKVRSADDPYTQLMRNKAFHQHNVFSFIKKSEHFSSVLSLLIMAQVEVSYCKQKAGQLVMSPPTRRVAHLVYTVDEYAD